MNSLEIFWSLLRLGTNGTYVSVEPFRLCRSLDRRTFRYNSRVGLEDKDRFNMAVCQIVGKRPTWGYLAGKTVEAAA